MVTTVMAVAVVIMMAVAMVTVAMVAVVTVVVVGVNNHGGLLVYGNRHGNWDLLDNRLGLVINWLGLRLVIDGSWLLRIILLRGHRLRIALSVTLRGARGMILRLHFFVVCSLVNFFFYYIIILCYPD